MKTLADLLRNVGAANSIRGQDTILAHINPKEAALLKRLGGSGRVDPITGALHFDEGNDGGEDNSDGDNNDDSSSDDSGWDSGPGDSGEDQDNQDSSLSGGSGAVSYGPDGESYAYGTYSGYDMATYGWGDPEVGYQDTPDAAAEAHEQLAIDAWNADPSNKGSLAWMTTPVPEEEYQYNADRGIGLAQGQYATPEALQAAYDEYNSLGWQGALTGDPWSFTDVFGNQQTNWGSVGRDTAQAIGQFGGLVGGLTGYGAIGAGIGALANLATGKEQQGLTTLGGLLGGSQGALAASILSNLASGKEGNALNTAINAGLNIGGLGLGSLAAGQFDRGSLESYLAGVLGNQAQGALVGSALSGLGVSNTGQAFGGWTGSGSGIGPSGDYTDSGPSSDAVSSVIGSLASSGASTGQGTGSGTSYGTSSQTGGYSGYTPITLDEVDSETGYDLIAEDYNTPLTLGNLLGTQNLYASSYGG